MAGKVTFQDNNEIRSKGVSGLWAFINGAEFPITAASGQTNFVFTTGTQVISGVKSHAGPNYFRDIVEFSGGVTFWGESSFQSPVDFNTDVSFENPAAFNNGFDAAGTVQFLQMPTHGTAAFVVTTGNQNISGVKSFLNGISGAAVTGGNLVYNTGDQTISGVKSFANGISGVTVTGSNLVYNTGTQTISGNKTFTGASTFKTITVWDLAEFDNTSYFYKQANFNSGLYAIYAYGETGAFTGVSIGATGYYSYGAPSGITGAALSVVPTGSGQRAAVFRARSGQSVNLVEFQTGTGIVTAGVNSSGRLFSDNLVYNTGSQTISGNKTFAAATVMSSDLTVAGTSLFNGTSNFGGDISANGFSQFNGQAQFNAQVDINNQLNVNSNATFTSQVVFQSDVGIVGNLFCYHGGIFNGTIDGTTTVDVHDGALVARAGFYSYGVSQAWQGMSIYGYFNNPSYIPSVGLYVQDGAIIGAQGIYSYTIAQFDCPTYVNNALYVNNGAYVNGNQFNFTNYATLYIDEYSYFESHGGNNFYGQAQFWNTTNFYAYAQFQYDAAFYSAATFQGTTSFNGNTYFSSPAQFNTSVGISSTLGVSGDTTLQTLFATAYRNNPSTMVSVTTGTGLVINSSNYGGYDGRLVLLRSTGSTSGNFSVVIGASIPASFNATFIRGCSGVVTFSGSGVTINNAYSDLTIPLSGARASLMATGTNLYNLA